MNSNISAFGGRKIILASTSPRRKNLMKKLGIKFKAVDSGYREKKYRHLSPVELVKILALGKARAVAKKYPNYIIVAADTIVQYHGKVLGKPRNKTDARRILKMLNGQTNYIITGMAVIAPNKIKPVIIAAKTKVVFRKYSYKFIEDYLATGEPLDRAGAYHIDDWGKRMAKKIIGDIDAAAGLPVKTLKKILNFF